MGNNNAISATPMKLSKSMFELLAIERQLKPKHIERLVAVMTSPVLSAAEPDEEMAANSLVGIDILEKLTQLGDACAVQEVDCDWIDQRMLQPLLRTRQEVQHRSLVLASGYARNVASTDQRISNDTRIYSMNRFIGV